MRNVQRILARRWLICLSLFPLSCAYASDTLHIVNDTDEVVTLWMRSEAHPPGFWNQWTLGRDGEKDVDLISPDRFTIACTDRGGAQFVSDLLPLHTLLQKSPTMVLHLKALAEAKSAESSEWDPISRIWERVTKTRNVVQLQMMFERKNEDAEPVPHTKLKSKTLD
jgi:hypothetical protein